MEKMRDLTLQLRRNQQDIGDYLKDLDSWTTDIKKQDSNLTTLKPREQAESAYPPVRSKKITEKVKKKREDEAKSTKKERIKSSDYRKWEKLDVDAMLQEVDDEEKEMEEEVQVEVEKLDAERKAKVAAEMKAKGNEHFKNGGYEAAIECYTTGMQADPSNPIFAANRAMAFLKLKRFPETEADCTLALSLDPSYTKAYLRRGAARIALGKSPSARKDFTDALKLEPGNAQAKAEIRKLDEIEISSVRKKTEFPKVNGTENKIDKKSRYVYPIFIPPKLRSKKPLVRVEVQEIGFEEPPKKNDRISKSELDSILGRDTETMITESSVKKTEPKSPKPMISIEAGGDAVKRKISQTERADEKVSCKVSSDSQKKKQTQSLSSNTDRIPRVTTEARTVVQSGDKKTLLSELSPPKTEDKGLTPMSGIPPCPATSFQFQANVKRLSNDLEALHLYLLQISPVQIPSLLKEQLETETLLPVLKCLQRSDSPITVIEYVSQFSKVKRFEMTVLFMSDVEKKDVKALFARLEKELPERKGEIATLLKKYGL